MIAKGLFDKLKRMATKPGLIALFILAHSTLLLMIMFTFPRINAKFGTQAFDLKTFGYSISEATVMLQNLDKSTINFYLFPQLFLLDILYPFLLAVFLSATIIRLSNLVNSGPADISSNLFLFPFITMFFDYSENIFISLMITNPNNVLPEIIKAANICTLMKGTFTTISWVLVLILFVKWLIRKCKSNKTITT